MGFAGTRSFLHSSPHAILKGNHTDKPRLIESGHNGLKGHFPVKAEWVSIGSRE
jgi:hypothetical protein